MKFAKLPKTISFNDLQNHKSKSFSASDHMYIAVNASTDTLENLVDELTKGNEVGSKSYLGFKTNYIFIRTKSIKRTSYLLEINNKEIAFISKETFEKKQKYVVKKNAILYTTGGDVGDVCISDTDIEGLLSSHIVQIYIKNKDLRYYVFSILKSAYGKEQIALSTPTGSIKGLDNFKMEYLKELKIPFPKDNTVIKKISIMMRSLIYKERELKDKFDRISMVIEEELRGNQRRVEFAHKLTTYKDLLKYNRFDTGLYTEKFKKIEHLIYNYKNGSDTITNLGFYSIRGQNLQVSQIGKSLYADSLKPNFYELFLPTNITVYGTIKKVLFIGNSKKLLLVDNEDIIFGAEGFEKGRSFIPLAEKGKFITNIHGTMLRSNTAPTYQKIFIKCMLDWFREKEVVDAYSVGGNGGSFSTKYWKILHFPLFDDEKQKEIAKLYYNPSEDYLNHISSFDLKSYQEIDSDVTKNSGILDLDSQIKAIKKIIDTEIKTMIS